MKKMMILTLMILFSGAAKALPTKEILTCNSGPGGVYLYLDSSGFTPGSGFSRPESATVTYKFTSAQQMTCDGFVSGANVDIWCVGFYQRGEITTVEFKTLPDGSYRAFWTTALAYGSRAMETPCVRSEQPPQL